MNTLFVIMKAPFGASIKEAEQVKYVEGIDAICDELEALATEEPGYAFWATRPPKPIAHLIFVGDFRAISKPLRYKATITYVVDDNNHGLPDWFFASDDYVSFVLDDCGYVEWIPGCGPAPCWKARYDSFKSHKEMLAAWDKWIRETY